MKRHAKKQTKILSVVLVLVLIAVAGVRGAVTVAAEQLTTTQKAQVQFTFNSSITLDIENKGNMSIGSLAPSSTGESQAVTVKVTTNNANGYSVTATVGDDKNQSTSLRQEGVSGEFKSINGSSAGTGKELSSFDENSWGFAYSEDDWKSGKTLYYGLPLDESGGVAGAGATTKGLEILKKDGPAAVNGDTVKCKIGAKAGSTIPSGTYQNTVHFYATTK